MSENFFTNSNYQRHNSRRQEHLASLGLPLASRTVLELGAGVGDHTSFFIDRGCEVTVTDARKENLERVRERFPKLKNRILDIDDQGHDEIPPHEIVYAYGILYHSSAPAHALAKMGSLTQRILLLETCVAFGEQEEPNLISEDASNPTQSMHGLGCRPTRPWIFARLKKHFQYVYLTVTQPWHEEFPQDWRMPPAKSETGLYRSVFVASRDALENAHLSDQLLDLQSRN